MRNFISIDVQEILLTDKQIKEIKKSFGLNNTKLSDVAIGDTFKIGSYEFIVLEHSKETTAVILKGLLHENERFGNDNNFTNSNVDKKCNEFSVVIANIIGNENLIEHTVDLTADDGLKDYGKIKRRMSLITAQLYRRYVDILDKHKTEDWWWTATARSAQKHGDTTWVKCVSPSWGLDIISYIGNCGVRPFCILNSNIFVSK